MDLTHAIKQIFNNTPDLIHKTISIKKRVINIFYLETVSSSDKVNEYILNDLILATSYKDKKQNLLNILAGPNTIIINSISEVISYISNGFTIIFDNNNIYAIETRADINRSVDRASIEASIKGPQDSFTENYQINIGLVKRRIKDPNLKIKNITVGKRSQTLLGILYIDDIINKELLLKIENKLKNKNIDAILDASDIAKIISNEKTRFPTIIETERPDNVANALLEGKIAIITDTANNALIIPGFLIDFINPASDRYTKSINVNFIKILRLFSFLISMLAPAIYIALSNFNQETLPTKILINFATQREGVPFPASIEVFLMLIICEILRESDLRFPSIFGSAISILGALILGEAAVSAGIVSPIIIIVVALSFICSLIFTDVNLISVLRYYRFLFLIVSSILGLYGILLLLIMFISDLTSLSTEDYEYTTPLAPFDINYLKKTLLSFPFHNNKYRSSLLAKGDKKKYD